MFNIDEEKEQLRKKYIEIRKNIKDKKNKSIEIFYQIRELEEFKTAKIIDLYKSLNTEVDTDRIINHCISENKTVVLPRVVDDTLKFYKIYSLDDKFEKSKIGVKEPIEDKSNLIEPNKIELIIVPGLCFDIYKNRLGFGKGFYDRFFSSINIKKIAICFEEQILKSGKIPTAPNDISVDKVITDKNIYL